MASSTLGIIFSNIQEKNVPELSKRRTMASIPFAGRYRLIDFGLSNMVNAGITAVGIVTKNNYQSLIDHLGSGKDWDLARKGGGIILLPPYSSEMEAPYTTRLEALMGVSGFLSSRREEYVVIYDCDGVARIDLADMLRFHEENNADVTMAYSEQNTIESHYFMTIEPDQTGRVKRVNITPRVDGKTKFNLYINVMIIKREYLLDILQAAVQRGQTSFGRDILAKNVDDMRIFGYKFDGYYAGIDSLQGYFKHSMEQLDKKVRDELYGARDIYTKVGDTAPTKYLEGAVVKNSLIADGCTIEGTVENSILFRGVKVGKGTVIKNSVIMQKTVIGSNVKLDSVITDKNVVIRDRRNLSGCAELPYFVAKGTML
ncbi:MAG: glucose-1-phosphate adenylyltransferase subunit GlgD [Clostridiales bacterium]|nr:glucose-1-phosphate adenylyltransferase subunit GlgD [Clostridiales bacterium]